MAIWVAVGFGLRLGADSYLLMGAPMTAAFMLFVSRRPLHAAWFRGLVVPRLDLQWAILALLLAAFPSYVMVHALFTGHALVGLWALAAVVGAGAAAFALRTPGPSLGSNIFRCLVTAGLVGVAIMIVFALQGAHEAKPIQARLAIALRSLLLYFPVCFTLEEVTFRGVLDSHLAPDGRGTRTSAIFVSVLWGIWHLPVIHTDGSPLSALPLLVVVHVLVGVPLSFAWRRSGNLAVPAVSHAVIDAVRNALLGG